MLNRISETHSGHQGLARRLALARAPESTSTPIGTGAKSDANEMTWLRALVEGTASFGGDHFLRNLVRHLAVAVGASHAFVAKFSGPNRASTLAYWKEGGIVPNIDFDLRATPCEEVVAGAMCFHASGVQVKFPREAGIESYVGVPLLSHEGIALGHLCAFDERPMSADPRRTCLLQIFAARAAAELDRLGVERRLRDSEDHVCRYPPMELKSVGHFEEIVGTSPALQQVLDHVNRVAPTDASVLISGETGTGKELIARAIHSRSARADQPFIKINCAALPAGLVESELFGHERGAFSGAIQRRIGRFELAHGGTLFLDEVGEIPKDVQVKLLRVLQEREFERVGGSQTIKCDVRVVAATNRNLEKAIFDGDFRSDLYYRLNVFPINLPALRERPDDIPLLAHFFVQKHGFRMGRKIESVDAQTLQHLAAYSWPGNIRELENIIERALILSTTSVLRIEPEAMGLSESPLAHASDETALREPYEDAAADAGNLNSVQRAHILSTLRDTHWVIEGLRGAAMRLGVKPATLRHRMKKLGIRRAPRSSP